MLCRSACVLLFVCAPLAAADPPGSDEWKYDVIYRKHGEPLRGLVLEQGSTIKIRCITRKPGKPTLVFTENVPRRDIARLELLDDAERAASAAASGFAETRARGAGRPSALARARRRWSRASPATPSTSARPTGRATARSRRWATSRRTSAWSPTRGANWSSWPPSTSNRSMPPMPALCRRAHQRPRPRRFC